MLLENDFAKMRTKESTVAHNKYLCPPPDAKMVIQGGYFDEQFSYVKLSVAACD